MNDDDRVDDKSKRQKRFRLKNVHSRKNKPVVAPKHRMEKPIKKAHRPKFTWDDPEDEEFFSEYEGYGDE